VNSLPPRLAAVADWVIQGKPVADIGSDHALLAIHLLESGYCPQAVITDINPLPLQRAQNMLASTGLLGRCDLRLGDGLAPLAPSEVATVCVAGMGGQTMADMIAAAGAKLSSYERLLLQPMNVFAPLRLYLSRSGYPICRERAVREGAGCFILLEVGTVASEPYPLTNLEMEVGSYVLAHPDEYDNRDYLEEWRQKYQARWAKMANSKRAEVKQQQQELLISIQRIEEVLAGC